MRATCTASASVWNYVGEKNSCNSYSICVDERIKAKKKLAFFLFGIWDVFPPNEEGRAMTHDLSGRSPIAESCFRFQASPCEICDRHWEVFRSEHFGTFLYIPAKYDEKELEKTAMLGHFTHTPLLM
jgi:hypothetical protein